jgi:Tol biopolymer transport system component
VLGATARVSVTADGGQLSGSSWPGTSSSLSTDGSTQLFLSGSPELPGGVFGGMIAYERQGGEVTEVSQGLAIAPSMNGDGSFVTYGYVDMVNPSNPAEVAVYDRAGGTWSTESVTAAGAEADGWSGNPLISDDGRWLAFETTSTMLTGAAENANGFHDIILRDRMSGTDTVVSLTPDGAAATGDCYLCALSPDGRCVAFASSSPALLPGTVVPADMPFVGYLYDATTRSLSRIDLKPDGSQPDDGVDVQMSFSSDDRYLAFGSYATDLVPGLTNGCENVFVRDLSQPLASAISCADIDPAGVIADQACYAPVITGDGRYLGFVTSSAVFDPNDTAGNAEIFLADRATGHFSRLSLASDGSQADQGASSPFALSRDGSSALWASFADNLVAGDTNGAEDVFEIQTGVSDAPPMPGGDG